jgi:hypothetical protein
LKPKNTDRRDETDLAEPHEEERHDLAEDELGRGIDVIMICLSVPTSRPRKMAKAERLTIPNVTPANCR